VFLARFTTVGGVLGASGSGISLKRGLADGDLEVLEDDERDIDMDAGSGEVEVVDEEVGEDL
jgi:hypothetical protein